MSMKYVCLAVLVLQTVTNVMLVRRARHLSCSVPIVVLCQEIVKLVSCCAVVVCSCGPKKAVSDINRFVIKDWLTTVKVGVPAFLYIIQNQLLFLALANLDTATYQITYQLKILTTAIFSIVLLRKKISVEQWLSLVLLTVGVILVQWRASESAASSIDSSSPLVGVMAILMACMTSGFAGVFFEMMLKRGGETTVWIRNIQLALCSCVVGLGNVLLTETDHMSQNGVFHDFQPVVLAVIFSQAYGGILIGLVVKYADNILKVFATSVSIIISSLIAIFYFNDLHFTLTFGSGLALVVTATAVYSLFPYREKAKTQ